MGQPGFQSQQQGFQPSQQSFQPQQQGFQAQQQGYQPQQQGFQPQPQQQGFQPQQQGFQQQGSPTTVSDRVFVKNVPQEIGRDELHMHFTQFGKPTDVYVPRQPGGQGGHKGIGFV